MQEQCRKKHSEVENIVFDVPLALKNDKTAKINHDSKSHQGREKVAVMV